MIWFLAGAAVSVAAFDWSGGGGSRRFWTSTMAALAAFGISLALPAPEAGGECIPGAGLACRAGLVIFAGLFFLSSICLGLGAMFRRLSGASFAVLALSDLALMVAVWTRVDESSSWTLPGAGDWGAGAKWAVLSAILRLGAPLAASGNFPFLHLLRTGDDRLAGTVNEAALLSVGWWQGALLAWWVGSGGRAMLALGGLALWPAAALVGRSRLGCLCAAGGLLSLGAATQASAAGLAAVGLAGVALALGAIAVGAWVLAIFPLSFLTLVELPAPLEDGPGLWLGMAILLPAAWALIAYRLPIFVAGASPSAVGGAPLSGGLLASTAALGAALAGFPQRGWVTWALAGSAVAILASAGLSGAALRPWRPRMDVRPVKIKPEGIADPTAVPVSRTGLSAAASLRTLAGWSLLSFAGLVFGLLVWAGLQTGFL